MDKSEIMNDLLGSPAWTLMGFKAEEYDEGFAKLSFLVSHQFLQNYNQLHGGFLFSLLDACAGAAVCPLVYPQLGVTLEAKINYISSVSGGKVIGEAQVVHWGKSTVVTTLKAYDTNDRNLAIGTATFAVLEKI